MLFTLKRYPFAEHTIQEAPASSGVYVLWEGDEVTLIGVASNGMTIRDHLLDRLQHRVHCACVPTHYSWRLATAPERVADELRADFKKAFKSLPRCNSKQEEPAS